MVSCSFTKYELFPGPATPGWGAGGHSTPTFLCSKKKKGKQRGVRKTFKAETIKTLSLMSKLCCLSHSRVSIIQNFFRQYFSLFYGPFTFRSILPALLSQLVFKAFDCSYRIATLHRSSH